MGGRTTNSSEELRRDSPKRLSLRTASTLFLTLVLVFAAAYFIIEYGWKEEDPCLKFVGSQPTGSLEPKEILGPTSVNVDFGRIYCDASPTFVYIILVKNTTIQGNYEFQSNEDGSLLRVWGENVGTIYYDDLADNRRVNEGDRLMMTNLTPDSEYTVHLVWAPTGDHMATTTFTTPKD